MKNILVTGSTGYIGGQFINEYNEKYKFKTFSLLRDKIEKIDFKNIDIILHCAAMVHQKVEYTYREYYEVNTKYPVELAKSAKLNGVKHFIFISTIAVYGNNHEYLKKETECNPVTPYGKSKLEAEKMLFELNDNSFKVSVIRPPMIYGYNAPGNIDSLIKLVQKLPIIPFANIKNKRSFLYIGNLCYIIDKIIEEEKSDIFLVSDDIPISTTELISVIAKNLNKKKYLISIPFFKNVLRLIKPNIYDKLYTNLELENNIDKRNLIFINPYTTEEGIEIMMKGDFK